MLYKIVVWGRREVLLNGFVALEPWILISDDEISSAEGLLARAKGPQILQPWVMGVGLCSLLCIVTKRSTRFCQRSESMKSGAARVAVVCYV